MPAEFPNIQCVVRKQVVDIVQAYLVADSVNYLYVTATFSNDWEGLQKWIHIRNVADATVHADVLLENDEVPTSTGLYLTAGEWDVWFHGSELTGENSDTLVKRITTNVKTVTVADSGVYADGSVINPDVEPSVAEQVADLTFRAEEAAEDAEASASDSEAWAVGERGGTPVTSEDETYHNNSKYYAGQAEDSADSASSSASTAAFRAADSEAWAVGQRGGQDVGSTDPTYHNNSKYYSDEAYFYQEDAFNYANNAVQASYDSEAWAKGTRNGVDVSSSDETYEQNSKYWAGDCERWAKGEVHGNPVTSGEPGYHDNSKYYANRASDWNTSANRWANYMGSDTSIAQYHDSAKYWASVAEDYITDAFDEFIEYGEQFGIEPNIFKFDNYRYNYTDDTGSSGTLANGISWETLSPTKVRLNGTSTAGANLNVSIGGFSVSDPGFYVSYHCSDKTIENSVYFRAGYFNTSNVAVQGDYIYGYDTVYPIETSNASTFRGYLHINSGLTLTNVDIEFYCFSRQPSVPFAPFQIFNAEPFVKNGNYDYKGACMRYNALFAGTKPYFTEAFTYFSDSHTLGSGTDFSEILLQNYYKMVQNSNNLTPSSFVLMGGDYLNSNHAKSLCIQRLGYLDGVKRNLFKNAYIVLGNHDLNHVSNDDSSDWVTIDEISTILFRDVGTRKPYYSFDGDNTKFYVLDSGDTGDHTVTTGTYDYDKMQLTWLCNLLRTQDATHSAIVVHMIYNGSSYHLETIGKYLTDIIAAYNGRSSSFELKTSGVTPQATIATYDFSACTGRIEFIVAGHQHTDSQGYISGVPYFITGSSAFKGATPWTDHVLVNYQTRTVNLVRCGPGEDRTFSLDES